MTGRLEERLASHRALRPFWVMAGQHDTPTEPGVTAGCLREMDPTDRRLCSLVYGLGIGLGAASTVLSMDPALASWRLLKCLRNAARERDPAALEAGIAALLSGRVPGPDAGPWSAREEVMGWPEEIRHRLEARLAPDAYAAVEANSRPGLGIGVLLLVGLAVLAITLYGAVRDADPIWRANDYIRLARYDKARETLAGLLATRESSEARVLTAIAWLSEGKYDEALAQLRYGGVARKLGFFSPFPGALEPVEADPDSGALLPRGPVMTSRPVFVYRAGPAGHLVLDRGFGRKERWLLPDTRGGPPIVEMPWPDAWPPLGEGSMTWTVPGSEDHPSSFMVIPREEGISIRSHATRFLSPDRIPRDARRFLRGNYYLRFFLYMQAGESFASLAKVFPEEAYPRVMVDKVAAALGVDPDAFLR